VFADKGTVGLSNVVKGVKFEVEGGRAKANGISKIKIMLYF